VNRTVGPASSYSDRTALYAELESLSLFGLTVSHFLAQTGWRRLSSHRVLTALAFRSQLSYDFTIQ